MSALGQDQYSNRLISELKKEGVKTDLILRHRSKRPGLYAIHKDEKGEREFSYWRDNSVMRDFFKIKEYRNAIKTSTGANWLYTTGITLSRFDQAENALLISMASAIRENDGQDELNFDIVQQ